jgi:hypothetical protein
VFLWRNQGKVKAVAGVVAEAIVTEVPRLRDEDAEGLAFWRELHGQGEPGYLQGSVASD